MRAFSGKAEAAWYDPFCAAEGCPFDEADFPLLGRDFDKSASLGVFFRFFRLISYFFVDNLFQLSYLAEPQVFRKLLDCEINCKKNGGVAEWLKAADCKSARIAYVGSNPTPTTII